MTSRAGGSRVGVEKAEHLKSLLMEAAEAAAVLMCLREAQ